MVRTRAAKSEVDEGGFGDEEEGDGEKKAELRMVMGRKGVCWRREEEMRFEWLGGEGRCGADVGGDREDGEGDGMAATLDSKGVGGDAPMNLLLKLPMVVAVALMPEPLLPKAKDLLSMKWVVLL